MSEAPLSSSLVSRWVRSANFNDRRTSLDTIILHYTGMENAEVALERLCDREAQVSAHYVVLDAGDVIQMVDERKRAWHAGLGYWHGERDMNSASIGIEIVNGGHDFGLPPYPDAQIDAVIALVRDLMGRHGIGAERVIGHSDIAPERKDDPGEHFPWERLARAGAARALPEGSKAETCDVRSVLTSLGYDPQAELSACVKAFQRRWLPERVSGELDAETRRYLSLFAH